MTPARLKLGHTGGAPARVEDRSPARNGGIKMADFCGFFVEERI